MAHSTGMAPANIDQLLARHQVQRKVALSVPGFHLLPMLIPNSDLVAIVPGMLAEAYASHWPIKVFAMVAITRYAHDFHQELLPDLDLDRCKAWPADSPSARWPLAED
jgi:hypothetical protein